MTLQEFLESNLNNIIFKDSGYTVYAKKPPVYDGVRLPDVDVIVTRVVGDVALYLNTVAGEFTILFRNVYNDMTRNTLTRRGYKYWGPACRRALIGKSGQ